MSGDDQIDGDDLDWCIRIGMSVKAAMLGVERLGYRGNIAGLQRGGVYRHLDFEALATVPHLACGMEDRRTLIVLLLDHPAPRLFAQAGDGFGYARGV